MKIEFRAAVLREAATGTPYADTRPLQIERVSASLPRSEEVLVRIEAASLCRSDLSVVDGVRAWPMPIVPGHEASGIVESVGSAVTTVGPGDHVVLIFQPQCGTCAPCSSGNVHLCEPGLAANRLGGLLEGGTRLATTVGGGEGDGEPSDLYHHMGLSAFAEYAVVSQHSLVKLPKELPLEVGALFGCGVMCGAGSVLNTAQVTPESTILIAGVGGVGSSAILGAKLAGASRIIAVDIDPTRLKSAKELGATDAILSGPDTLQDVIEHVLSITNGGVDYAFETAGKIGAFETAFHSARRGGMVVTLGLVDPKTPFSLDVAALVTSAKTVKGSYIGSCNPTQDIPAYVELFQSGQFPVDKLITHRLPLAEINTALDRMVNNQALRQIVLPQA